MTKWLKSIWGKIFPTIPMMDISCLKEPFDEKKYREYVRFVTRELRGGVIAYDGAEQLAIIEYEQDLFRSEQFPSRKEVRKEVDDPKRIESFISLVTKPVDQTRGLSMREKPTQTIDDTYFDDQDVL